MKREYVEHDISKMCKALLDWADKDTSTALCQFVNEQNIHSSYIYRWRDLHDEFSDALDKAKIKIAIRLRDLIKDKDKVYMSELGFHDPFYHEYTQSLKDADTQRSVSIQNAPKQPIINIIRVWKK